MYCFVLFCFKCFHTTLNGLVCWFALMYWLEILLMWHLWHKEIKSCIGKSCLSVLGSIICPFSIKLLLFLFCFFIFGGAGDILFVLQAE